MFAAILYAIDETTEEEGDVIRAFQLTRAKSIANFMKFSGMSQAEAANKISVSPTFIQKMISQPQALVKQLDLLTTMLALPNGSISSPTRLVCFTKENPVYSAAIDAVLTYTSTNRLPTGTMPRDYIINEVKRYLHDDYRTECDRLVAYFTSPSQEDEPDSADILLLEDSLEVPVGAIEKPFEVAATKTRVNMLSLATRKKINANITRIKEARKLTDLDIASRAGVSLAALENLRQKPFRCTLALVVALASALEVEPHQLMQDCIKTEVEEPLKPYQYEGLSQVSRNFIADYITTVRDQRDGLPTAKASAVLLATPFLQHAIGLLSTYSSQGSDEDSPSNLGDLVNQMVTNLRVGL